MELARSCDFLLYTSWILPLSIEVQYLVLILQSTGISYFSACWQKYKISFFHSNPQHDFQLIHTTTSENSLPWWLYYNTVAKYKQVSFPIYYVSRYVVWTHCQHLKYIYKTCLLLPRLVNRHQKCISATLFNRI